MAKTITLDDAAETCAEGLLNACVKRHMDIERLRGLTPENFNLRIDNIFDDGGEVRCEEFADLAWAYAGQFGDLGSDPFEKAQWDVIVQALQIVQERMP